MKVFVFALFLCGASGMIAFGQKPTEKRPGPSAQPSKPIVRDVTVNDAAKLIEARKDLVVLDVRTKEEYDMAHIPGARNASFTDTTFEDQLKEYEGKPVLVHCAAGGRSLRAVMKMQAEGKFSEIYHMAGGFAAWEEAGKTVVQTAKPK